MRCSRSGVRRLAERPGKWLEPVHATHDKTPDEFIGRFVFQGSNIQSLCNSARTVIPMRPIGAFHRFDANERTLLWRVNKLILTDVNANVRRSTSSRIKEHEVTRMQIRLRDRHALTADLGRNPRQ